MIGPLLAAAATTPATDPAQAVADGVGIMGEDGHDDILVVGEQSLMDGGAGNDVLTGSPFRDEVVGGEGNDTINLNQGDAELCCK